MDPDKISSLIFMNGMSSGAKALMDKMKMLEEKELYKIVTI